jgi:predicted ATP-grasp superfamily ATP-dependent carboligase
MEDSTSRVLVLDSNTLAGLSIVRSLGRRGVHVTTGSDRRIPLARLSRFSDDAYRYPDPERDCEAFLTHLSEHLTEREYFAVVPVADSTSALLSKHKDEIEQSGTTVAVEDWGTFRRAYHKNRTFELAADLSVPTPTTRVPESPSEVADLATGLPYPVVLKPRTKTVWTDAGRCHYTEITDDNYIQHPAALVDAYRTYLEERPVLQQEDHLPLVQEYIEGTTTTTVVLADDGDVVTHFQEERVRTYPSSGGNSTLLGALVEPTMLEYAEEVIGALEWTGPAMVEFMRTPDDEFYLIEVNGRYWGSVPFAISCGVDFPWLQYQQLHGRSPDAPQSYRTDVREQRLFYGDIKWLVEKLRQRDPRAAGRFLHACLTARQTFLSYEDPVPSIGVLLDTLRIGVDAVLEGTRGGLRPG